MSTPEEEYANLYKDQALKVAKLDPKEDTTLAAAKTLQVIANAHPYRYPTEPAPEPVPTTFGGKFKKGAVAVYESETTRAIVKAGGALAGVVAVIYATIHKDHVLERQSVQQANQKP